MKKLYYLFILLLAYIIVPSCDTIGGEKKCWNVLLEVDIIVENRPKESTSFTVEYYIWLSEVQIEREVEKMIKEIKEEFEDYDEVNITNKIWKITDIETEESCKEINGEIERRWGSDYW